MTIKDKSKEEKEKHRFAVNRWRRNNKEKFNEIHRKYYHTHLKNKVSTKKRVKAYNRRTYFITRTMREILKGNLHLNVNRLDCNLINIEKQCSNCKKKKKVEFNVLVGTEFNPRKRHYFCSEKCKDESLNRAIEDKWRKRKQ